MPVHIDIPAPGMAFDPRRFIVRGWVWLEDRHSELAAVEAWCGNSRLGAGMEFVERADVSTLYSLPPGTRTAFEFPAAHPSAAPNDNFIFDLRPRFRDGTLGPPIFTSLVGPFPLDRDPLAMLRRQLTPRSLGLEIGAHTQPTSGLNPFYTDAVADFADTAGRVDFLSDATALPLPDDALDYLCSSHVLEHLPNPLAALFEWHRVLRPGGSFYLVVPDKRYTFDHPRKVTSAEHLLQDFREGRNAVTSWQHVEEFVHETDWSLHHPEVSATERPHAQQVARRNYLRAIRQGRAIDVHFHTFTPESLRAVLAAAKLIGGANPRFVVQAEAERYPPDRRDGIAMLLSKTGAPSSTRPMETYTLTRNDGGPALPLVCPVSLSPLHEEVAADNSPAWVSADAGTPYPFTGSLPTLMPPAGVLPQRAWSRHPVPVPSPNFTLNDLAECHVDEPAAGTIIDPAGFFVRGWLWLESWHPALDLIEAWSGDTLLGSTATLYDRPDVTQELGLTLGISTGFGLSACHPRAKPGEPVMIEIRARLNDGTRTNPLAQKTVATIRFARAMT